jgi:hypothetical protein
MNDIEQELFVIRFWIAYWQARLQILEAFGELPA